MVNDDDVRELFDYMSSCDGISSNGSSEPEPMERSFIWDPENDNVEMASSNGDDSSAQQEEIAEDQQVSDGSVSSDSEPGKGVRALEIPQEIRSDQLTAEEIALLRMQLRDRIGAKQAARTFQGGEGRSKFKVPKEHPVFDGEPEKLELFIMDMQLSHEEWTMGRMGSKHNPSFIMKLLPYFKAKSSVALWFKMYASERRQKKKNLSWNQLVKDLRKDYGVFDRPEKLFETYWDLKQTGSVHDYIARKKAAALLAKDLLCEQLLLFGFIRGLKVNVETYVKLQKPQTLKEAQKYALVYENSNSNKNPSNKTSENSGQLGGQGKSGSGQKRKRPTSGDTMSDAQRTALSDLRALRKQGCFSCGKPDHKRDQCKSDNDTKSKHMFVVKSLKDKINGST